MIGYWPTNHGSLMLMRLSCSYEGIRPDYFISWLWQFFKYSIFIASHSPCFMIWFHSSCSPVPIFSTAAMNEPGFFRGSEYVQVIVKNNCCIKLQKKTQISSGGSWLLRCSPPQPPGRRTATQTQVRETSAVGTQPRVLSAGRKILSWKFHV